MAKQGEPLTAKTAERQSIPLENIVVSEIPLAKAVSIGHLEVKEPEFEGKDK